VKEKLIDGDNKTRLCLYLYWIYVCTNVANSSIIYFRRKKGEGVYLIFSPFFSSSGFGIVVRFIHQTAKQQATEMIATMTTVDTAKAVRIIDFECWITCRSFGSLLEFDVSADMGFSENEFSAWPECI
jgi:hypothetical protein